MGRGLIFKLVVLCLVSFTSFMEAKAPDYVRKEVASYLLPNDHPIKSSLDYFFSAFRVTLNLDTLKKAGFTKPVPRKFTNLIVLKHAAFPGYIFKLYVDAQRYYKELREDQHWVLRIQGADLVREAILKLGLETEFKVPCKWIYQLPDCHIPPKGYLNKYYILIEEDMDILPKEENKKHWASDAISHDFLDRFYSILTEVGLSDCAKPDNAPFSVDGKIAFIDTETFARTVNYHKLTPYLSKSNKKYWKSITSHH